MRYEIRNPATAEYFFWHTDGLWVDVIACGDLNIKGWVASLRRAGFCICRRKKVSD